MSRIFHPCILVPQIHVWHFPPLHFWPFRIFMSRISSRPNLLGGDQNFPTHREGQFWFLHDRSVGLHKSIESSQVSDDATVEHDDSCGWNRICLFLEIFIESRPLIFTIASIQKSFSLFTWPNGQIARSRWVWFKSRSDRDIFVGSAMRLHATVYCSNLKLEVHGKPVEEFLYLGTQAPTDRQVVNQSRP